MLEFLVILSVACAVAYGMTISRRGYGRVIFGFLVAVIVGWLGGSLLVAYGAALLRGGEEKQYLLLLLGRGLGWSLLGASIGVLSARLKSRATAEVSTFAVLKRGALTVLAVTLAGFVLVIALLEYQDYTNSPPKPSDVYQGHAEGSQKPWEEYQDNAEHSQKPWEAYQAQSNVTQGNARSGDRVISQAATDSNGSAEVTAEEHARRIYAAHPDADKVFKSADFKNWLARYPVYQRIATQGTTQEVIEMFTAYKNQLQSNPYR